MFFSERGAGVWHSQERETEVVWVYMWHSIVVSRRMSDYLNIIIRCTFVDREVCKCAAHSYKVSFSSLQCSPSCVYVTVCMYM